MRRYTPISAGMILYRPGEGEDIGAVLIRRYPAAGGYRCIGVSVRRRLETHGLHHVNFTTIMLRLDPRKSRNGDPEITGF